ncbi:hypothetical protein [Collinsella provencensis]|uniref:hypothetical protein n=1 Tax=Collinsella provencensis TaxID=1937461 RepID=UPI000C845C53|nr:hypothetical protein [Collinsella provencensis]
MDDRFLCYFSIVQEAASELGRVFFLYSGEGHDLITEEIDCENLSGWLVKQDDIEEFESLWAEMDWGSIPDRFALDMVVAEWSGTGPDDIMVSFDFYNEWMRDEFEATGILPAF